MFEKVKKWSTIKIVLIIVGAGIILDLLLLRVTAPRIIFLGGV